LSMIVTYYDDHSRNDPCTQRPGAAPLSRRRFY
jgi:hypothetical protein